MRRSADCTHPNGKRFDKQFAIAPVPLMVLVTVCIESEIAFHVGGGYDIIIREED